MPNARPWRTRRSSSSDASWASLSSSVKNSWNSSTISRMRGVVSLRPGGPVAGQIVHAGVAEVFAALAEDAIEPLQDAQAELPLALDGHDPGVGQADSWRTT